MAKSVQQIPGVLYADVNFASGLLVMEYDRSADPRLRVADVVAAAGHGLAAVRADEGASFPRGSWWDRNRSEVSVAISACLIAAGWLLESIGSPAWSTVMYALAIVVGGSLVWRRAAASIRARSLDMNILMSLAVAGAAALGEWSEGAAVIVLFALGGLLESRSVARTRRSIGELIALAPESARVRRDGAEVEVSPKDVAIGETVVVRPGERVPLDGVIVEGVSAFDESPVTGESVPVDRGPGDAVFAGSLNTSGLVAFESTTLASDTTLARIIQMVENAQAGRAPVQRFVDRFSRVYTPVVVVSAAALAVGGPLLGQLGIGWAGVLGWREWLYRALTLLVISCPCALVLSTPVAIVSAITRAAKDGVLVKGGAFLEAAAGTKAVVFDKTGTLTEGRPEVADTIVFGGFTAERVLALAAAVEAHSNHPLAIAVALAAPHPLMKATAVRETAGAGVSGLVDGVLVSVGSVRFVEQAGCLSADVIEAASELEERGLAVLVVSVGEGESARCAGLIGVADSIRPEAAEAVSELKRVGIERIVMLTGDSEAAAARVASRVGITEYRARLLPEDKSEAVLEIKGQHGCVALVGDGVNDAPALAAADIGIAMAAAGSHIAIETADVALMGDDLRGVPRFLVLGRRTMQIIRENVFVSVAVKILFIALALSGRATLWMAVFADTGVALIVIGNGLRLLRARKSRSQQDMQAGAAIVD